MGFGQSLVPDEATGAQLIAAAGLFRGILRPNGFGFWAKMDGEALVCGAGHGGGVRIDPDGRVSSSNPLVHFK